MFFPFSYGPIVPSAALWGPSPAYVFLLREHQQHRVPAFLSALCEDHAEPPQSERGRRAS